MTEIAPANMNALRWDALLVEYGVLEKEHRELLFSFTRPFSAEQNAELNACVARRHVQMEASAMREYITHG